VQVVPDKIGGQSSSYNDFVCSLPDNQCRYAGEQRGAVAGLYDRLLHLALHILLHMSAPLQLQANQGVRRAVAHHAC
jgi:hypothetical protein